MRQGPTRLSVFALPGVDEAANAVEYFTHHQDVRRAGDAPAAPRDLAPATENGFWRRLRLLGRAMFRRAEVGVVVERADRPSAGLAPAAERDRLRVSPGSATVTLVGRPSELLLYASGRRSAAEVRAVGEDDALARLAGTRLAI